MGGSKTVFFKIVCFIVCVFVVVLILGSFVGTKKDSSKVANYGTFQSVSVLRAKVFLKDSDIALEQVLAKADELSKSSTFSENEILETLAWSVSWYKNWNVAMEKTKTAMDVAAFSQKSLEEVRVLLGLASNGDVEALKTLGGLTGVSTRSLK